jgi:hypothetical protein
MSSHRQDGAGTGVTLGCATGIQSFVHTYKDYSIEATSMEIVIHPYSNKEGPFSAPGALGLLSVITGSTGPTDSTDVTFMQHHSISSLATSRKHFPIANLPDPWPNPSLGCNIMSFTFNHDCKLNTA